MRNRITTLVAISGIVAACSPSTEVTCTAVGIPSVAVRVRDAATGAYVAGGATLIARSAATADTVTLPDNRAVDSQELAGGLGWGTFELVIRKPGYQEWRRSDVRVERSNADRCHPRTERLEATLTRMP